MGDTEQKTTWDLKLYLEQRKRRYLPLAGKFTQEEATSIAAFYFYTVKPIAEHYAHWSLANLATFVAEDSHIRQKEATHIITVMETMRFARAIYRFQVFCGFAGYNIQSIELGSISRSMESRDENVLAFIDAIEPWEIEEMYSFYQFAQEVYDNIFSKICRDLHPDNPRFEDYNRPPTPEGAFYLDTPSKFGIFG